MVTEQGTLGAAKEQNSGSMIRAPPHMLDQRVDTSVVLHDSRQPEPNYDDAVPIFVNQ